MLAGRPTKYSQEIMEELCARRAKGESIKVICEDEHMPCRKVFYDWLLDDSKEPLRNNYAQAIDIDSENIFDGLIDIAKDCSSEGVNRARLEIDTKKWVLSRRKPKKYGDKIRKEVSGPDGGPIPMVNANLEITPDMDPKEAADRYARLVKGEG